MGCLNCFVAVLAFIVYNVDYVKLQSYCQRNCQSRLTLIVYQSFCFCTHISLSIILLLPEGLSYSASTV